MTGAIGLFLLMLLKFLGWALLILLLILLTVLLLVLFVPVKYDVRIQNERSMKPGQNGLTAGLHLYVKVNWLLHVTVSYGSEGIQKQIRVAGIDIFRVLTKLADRKRKKTGTQRSKRRRALHTEIPEDAGKYSCGTKNGR